MQIHMHMHMHIHIQVRRAYTEVAVATKCLDDADAELAGASETFHKRQAAETARRTTRASARALVVATERCATVAAEGGLRWALATWASAAAFSEMGPAMADVRERVAGLALTSQAMAVRDERLTPCPCSYAHLHLHACTCTHAPAHLRLCISRSRSRGCS